MKTKKELLNYASSIGVSLADTKKIIQYCAELDASSYFVTDDYDENVSKKIHKNIEKLSQGYPLAYILGETDFYGRSFFITPDVLIPRYDTEVLIEVVLQEKTEACILIDIGTGSGIIPITLGKERSFGKIYAVDISETALKIAEKNTKRHEINIDFFMSDLLSVFLKKHFEIGKAVILTANLPYIKNGDTKNISPETEQYEPELALYGGQETGFELYKTLINQVFVFIEKYKIKEISVFIEIGFDQLDIAKAYLKEKNLSYKIFHDTNNYARVIKIFDFHSFMIQ